MNIVAGAILQGESESAGCADSRMAGGEKEKAIPSGSAPSDLLMLCLIS